MSDGEILEDQVAEDYPEYASTSVLGDVSAAEWGEMVLGPYEGNPALWGFPIAAQVRTARMAVFPPRVTLGDPQATRIDTLAAWNISDLSGGSGIEVINESTDLQSYWDGDADPTSTKFIVGGPLVSEAKPASYSGNAVPLGTIGTSIYAMWGTKVHKWDPDNGTWGAGTNITYSMPDGAEGCRWEGYTILPNGGNGYTILNESVPGTINNVGHVNGAADPTTYDANALSHVAPKAISFCVWAEKLWAITTTGGLCFTTTAAELIAGTWHWPYNTTYQKYTRLDASNLPKVLFRWTDNDGNPALGVTAVDGCYRFDDTGKRWKNTNVEFPAGHSDYGQDVEQWRPGEAWHITGGAGDIVQVNAQGVVVPGTGPAAKGDGVPAFRRGTVKFLASEPAFLYALVQGDPAASNVPTWIEDNSGQDDPPILPDSSSVTTLYRNNGKAWFPTWSSDGATGNPFGMAVGSATRSNGTRDYRLFWSVGETMYSMALKWTMYSSRQGRLRGLDAFRQTSFVEWGQFDGNLQARPKLASHLDVNMDWASRDEQGNLLEWTDWYYQTERDDDQTWHFLGTADKPGLNILEFGMSGDGLFAKGLSFYWIKLRAEWNRANGASVLLTPIFRSASLAYMEIPQDAASYIFTVPLVMWQGRDPEYLAWQLESLLEMREFCLLDHRGKKMRVYVSSISGTDLAGARDADEPMGVRTVTVAQIRSGGRSIGND